MMRKAMILVLPALFALGCDDSGSSNKTPADGSMGGGGDMAMMGGGGGDMAMGPARPTLGAQIDRMGRPAINTALTDPFNFDNMHAQTQDAYNQESDPAKWQSTFVPKIAGNLAILDVLDGHCGNQALYDTNKGGVNFSAAGYTTLAGALADDELYVNSASSTCSQYLAVELGVITQKPTADCGGRAPSYDVIDVSYTVLSGAVSPVSDGVSMDADNPPSAMFPFIGAPNM